MGFDGTGFDGTDLDAAGFDCAGRENVAERVRSRKTSVIVLINRGQWWGVVECDGRGEGRAAWNFSTVSLIERR